MKFHRIKFSLTSFLVGVHYGRNPATKQAFLHVAPLPFVGLDFGSVSEEQARAEASAVRQAVRYALQNGIATDTEPDGSPSSRSLVSLAERMDLTIPQWCYDREAVSWND